MKKGGEETRSKAAAYFSSVPESIRSGSSETHTHNNNNPTTNGGMQNWKLGRNMYTLRTYFCTFRADSYARSVIINKISASELSRKFAKSALLVGTTRAPPLKASQLQQVKKERRGNSLSFPSSFFLCVYERERERKKIYLIRIWVTKRRRRSKGEMWNTRYQKSITDYKKKNWYRFGKIQCMLTILGGSIVAFLFPGRKKKSRLLGFLGSQD